MYLCTCMQELKVLVVSLVYIQVAELEIGTWWSSYLPHEVITFISFHCHVRSYRRLKRLWLQSVVPPPPPMPPPPEDPSEVRPFMDPYGRAKTVRIGKWRWPPPKDDSDTSFMQFKLKQRRKHSQVITSLLNNILMSFSLFRSIHTLFLCSSLTA